MENEKNNWRLPKLLIRAVIRESGRLFYKLRIPAAVLLFVLAVIGLLPKTACDFLRNHVPIIVVFANTFLALTFFCGIFFLPEAILAAPYEEDPMYPSEKIEGLSGTVRLTARILIAVILTAVMLLIGNLGSILMEKFSTESIQWFHVNFIGGFWKQLILAGLIQPFVFFWIFLYHLRLRQKHQYVLSYILAGFLCKILNDVAEKPYQYFVAGSKLPAGIQDGFWYLIMLVFALLFFVLSVRAQKRLA